MDNYQFSNTYRASCVAYSPGSTFIATALKDKVHIRSTSSLESIRTWACSLPDEPSTSCLQDVTIDTLDWSPGGSFLLVFSYSRGVVWVFDIAQDHVVARVQGVHQAEWGVDDLVTQTEAGLVLYNLTSGRNRLIQNVQGHAWSPDKDYLAVPERHHGKQYVGVYDKESLIRHFEVLASGMSGISWSPCGKWLALLDWALSYTVHFYSPVGVHVGSFVPDLITASAHDMAQSIKRTAWSPNGRHFAIGDSGGLVHVVESEGWKSIANLRGYQAVSISEPALRPWSHGQANIVQFERASVTPSASPIHWLGFSPDGTVLFFGQDTVLHVYAFLLNPASSKPDIEPTVTVSFNAPIKSVEYCPTSNRVAVVTRTKFLYLYDGLGVEGVEIPVGACSSDGLNANRMAESFAAMSVHWAPDGNSAAVCDKNDFCLVYEEAAGQGAEVDTWDEL